MRRWILTSVGLSAAMLCAASRVSAHAEVVRSTPTAGERLAEPPPQVSVWFGEELVTRESTLQVFDAGGRRVDAGDGYVDLDDPEHASMVVSLPPLPDGVFTVRWHAVTPDDLGVTDGEFDFLVGNAVPAPKRSRPSISTLDWLPLGVLVFSAIVMARLAVQRRWRRGPGR